ncbi:uncharacterized protein EV420DRAFT_1477021 [Desarmillaria tabescens]|uniref:Uncharacterized protein n=1 Tax=Armillaria tabescens TaxID=1929756 RepID=A0AA39TXE4_ARMTA|nr:uncharacterized protein EV420DRAFT_1477021 [Desarmillaria tabescens]KAK0462270.1 hypothetical protein EV420DRAFT_1477021 [Desarmillaria tabescens]
MTPCSVPSVNWKFTLDYQRTEIDVQKASRKIGSRMVFVIGLIRHDAWTRTAHTLCRNTVSRRPQEVATLSTRNLSILNTEDSSIPAQDIRHLDGDMSERRQRWSWRFLNYSVFGEYFDLASTKSPVEAHSPVPILPQKIRRICCSNCLFVDDDAYAPVSLLREWYQSLMVPASAGSSNSVIFVPSFLKHEHSYQVRMVNIPTLITVVPTFLSIKDVRFASSSAKETSHGRPSSCVQPPLAKIWFFVARLSGHDLLKNGSTDT